MAFVHGKDSVFSLDDSGGTERNLSTFVDNVSGPMGRALAEVSAFGDEGVRNIPGLQNSQFTVSGHWDPTATTGPHAVLSGLLAATATSTFKFGPGGSGSGAARLTGECWLTSFNITSAVSNKVSFEAGFQVDGVVTFDTYP
jgi:hypothetical protein